MEKSKRPRSPLPAGKMPVMMNKGLELELGRGIACARRGVGLRRIFGEGGVSSSKLLAWAYKEPNVN